MLQPNGKGERFSMQFVVHFGSPKTGSTAIQSSLFRAREALNDMGHFYPSIADRIDHTALLPRQDTTPPYKWHFDEDAWSEFREQISHSNPEVVILSSEYLFNRKLPGLKLFNKRISTISPEIKYVGYIRSPKPRYLSGVQQWIKYTSNIKSPCNPLMYRRSLEKILNLSRGNAAIRVFERDRLLRGDIVFDFLCAGAGVQEEQAERIPVISANESVSAEGMVLLQKINAIITNGKRKLTVTSGHLLTAIQTAELHGSYSRPKLQNRVEDIVDQVNNSDMVWVRNELGLAFSDAMADEHFVLGSSYEFPSEPHMSDIIEFNSDKLVALENRVLVELIRQQRDVRSIGVIAIDGDDRPDLSELMHLADGAELAAAIKAVHKSLAPLPTTETRPLFRGAGDPAKAQIAAKLINRIAKR